MKLRDYQEEGIASFLTAIQDNDSALGVLYTGGGKTIMFAAIAKLQPKRVIVVAHREELIWQARDKIVLSTGLECEIEMAGLSCDASLFAQKPIVIATIQTLTAGGNGGRMTKFNPMDFSLIIIDEAHHATAQSYQRFIKYMRDGNPAIKLLGVTATPDRSDEEALGQIFKVTAFDYEILEGIHGGWLVPIDQQMIHIKGLDFSSIHTDSSGDLNGSELAAIMEAEHNLQGVVGSAIQIIGDKRTLMFTSSVAHAERSCEIFNRHKANSAKWVCGKTDKEERRKMLAQFASGEIQIVVNCSCLTEGFDNPGVEVIVQAKPTKSRALYAQMIGRATRPLAGIVDGPETSELRRTAIAASAKQSCLIVDYCGNAGRHKLMSSADILGGNVSPEAVERATEIAKESDQPVRMSALLDQTEAAIQKMAEQRRLFEERRKAEEERRKSVKAKVTFVAQKISPFEELEITKRPTRGWDEGRTLSEKERAWLQGQGENPDELGYVNGKLLIREFVRRKNEGLPTWNQVKKLKQCHYDHKQYTFKTANALIDRIAANGWKRPDPLPAQPIKPVEPGKVNGSHVTPKTSTAPVQQVWLDEHGKPF